MNTKKTLGIMTLIIFTLNNASAATIRSANSKEFVKITQTQEQRIKFESCVKFNSQETCEVIGNKVGYSLTELQSLRKEMKRNGYALYAIDALIVIAAAGFVGYLASLTQAAEVGFRGPPTYVAKTIASFLGGILGAGAGTVIITHLDNLFPSRRLERARTIDDELLISDKEIQAKSMSEYIARIQYITGQLDNDKAVNTNRVALKPMPTTNNTLTEVNETATKAAI